MKFLELCAGIGGFRVALENLGCECAGYSEIDKNAIKLYSAFFNDERNFGDVTKIEAEKLPDFDILVGGFPCQAFSVAGKRLGFEDTRGTIFFDFARILKAKKPTFGIFENVRGLLNHERGRTFETIIKTLDEIGYDAQWGIINTRFHGLPQNRERVYIVANFRERSATKILFERGDGITDKVARTQQSIIGDYHTKSGKTHQRSGVLNENSIAPCLIASDYKEPRMVKIGAIDGKRHQADRVYSLDGVSTTLSAQGGGLGAKTGLYSAGDKVRRLTPKECFRLQGFKDEMVELGYKIGLSDTALYKAVGNAVSVPVVEWVAGRVLSWDNLRDANELGSDYLF
ncbi:MAG: DNA (cytosine-5-)-methyltransferase [Campylobacter sp.]|uniref:DNA (cytosine-5-)-methyltransferase n=1 Tax=Campylobacter sp. TaxID=205 RepID=UPI002AA7858B|nr:DNA (cytosine-5-)-methyltransferase [Campylobacter sp.]MCI6343595.1 DNA (cytosine-5-)-methyltransferase [Campylobacter sp.]MCI6694688.1 DNA (cytosine-5-)-methyltransferase [Campylobacter sp.]